MGKALREFVDKEEKDAIKELVKWELGKVQNELFKRNAEEDTINDLVVNVQEKKEDVDEEEENEEIEKVCSNISLTLSHPDLFSVNC